MKPEIDIKVLNLTRSDAFKGDVVSNGVAGKVPLDENGEPDPFDIYTSE